MPDVKFLRVLGVRSKEPYVIAAVNGHLVKWKPSRDWSCDCDMNIEFECDHIDIVRGMLDPRVTSPHPRVIR